LALVNAAESDPAWDITRIEEDEVGAVVEVLQALGVAWTDRFTVIYA
jgi:hypothetical protein